MISKEKEQWNLFSVFLLLKMYVFGGEKETPQCMEANKKKKKLQIEAIDKCGR